MSIPLSVLPRAPDSPRTRLMPAVTIVADYVKCKILELLSAEVNLYIDSKTKYHPDGYDKTWNFKKKRWDGYNHTYDIQTQVFRVGLLQRVQHALAYHGYQASIQRVSTGTLERIDPHLDDQIIRPFEYQAKVRQKVQEH